MDFSKHAFGLGSIALSLVALLLNIISVATVGWLSGTVLKSSGTWNDFRAGLWQTCVKHHGPGWSEHCGSTASVHAANLDAARGLEILAMLVGIFAAVLTASLVFKFLEKALEATKVTSFMTRPKVVSVISIVSALLTLGGIIAYAIDYSASIPIPSTVSLVTTTSASPNYSFYMSIVAALAYLINGILLRCVKVDSEESTQILP